MRPCPTAILRIGVRLDAWSAPDPHLTAVVTRAFVGAVRTGEYVCPGCDDGRRLRGAHPVTGSSAGGTTTGGSTSSGDDVHFGNASHREQVSYTSTPSANTTGRPSAHGFVPHELPPFIPACPGRPFV